MYIGKSLTLLVNPTDKGGSHSTERGVS